MALTKVWNDDAARISFAVLGIFLILGSSVTSVYVSMNDQLSFEEHTWNKDQQHIEKLLSLVRTDVEQIINTAGISALQYISSHPIILASDQFSSAEEANRFRLKEKIAATLTNYILCNYETSNFRQNSYILHINLSQLPQKRISPNDITIESIPMQLQRSFSIPFFGPTQQQKIPVYYKIYCDIPVTIQNTEQFQSHNLEQLNLPVQTVITSRFHLLHHLLCSYNSSLNGFGSLWKTLTLITNIYSMARGYQHYHSGKPMNVMDNTHLELLTNLVLLLEEALTFNGVDPNLLLDSVKQAISIFSQKKTTNTSLINSFSTNEWTIPFTKFQHILENDEPEKSKPVQPHQLINISDIAGSLLWNLSSVILEFKDKMGTTHTVTYEYDANKTFEETLDQYHEKGWQLTDSSKGTKIRNQSTMNQIQHLSQKAYSAVFHTTVHRNGPINIIQGNHSGFDRDNDSTAWSFHQAVLTSQKQKPAKGTISLGSTVFEETYTVIWKRTHHWSKKIVQNTENNTKITWKEYNSTDTRIEENVTFSIILDSYAQMNEYPGRIKNVFYQNDIFKDTNLKTTIESYRTSVYASHKKELFTKENGNYYTQRVYEIVPQSVISSIDHMLQDVVKQVSSITRSNNISVLNYPNPKTLVTRACEYIIQQFESNKTRLIKKEEYFDQNEFRCTAKKAEFISRKWFVNKLGEQLYQYKTELYTDVDSEISEALAEADVPDSTLFDETMEESVISSFERQLVIPFSLPLKLSFQGENTQDSWNESVLFTIDHHPGYSSCFKKEDYEGKESYYLGIQNTCLLGPSGVPILPVTPSTPWLVTLNTWVVQIRGSYALFSLYDAGDETVFHPLFCHEPLQYERKHEIIRASDGTILGWNQPISYAVDTVSCAIVPSWGCMVGDTDGILIEHDGKQFS